MRVILGSLLTGLYRGWSYFSVLWPSLSAVLKNPTGLWRGSWGRREGRINDCYSTLHTELGVLAFLGSLPSKSLTHMILAYLTLWRCSTQRSIATGALSKTLQNRWRTLNIELIDAGMLPPLHGFLGIMSLFFLMIAAPPNFYWQVGFTPTTPSLRKMLNRVAHTPVSVWHLAFPINYRLLFSHLFLPASQPVFNLHNFYQCQSNSGLRVNYHKTGWHVLVQLKTLPLNTTPPLLPNSCVIIPAAVIGLLATTSAIIN